MSKRSLQLACLTGALCIALCGCSFNISIGGAESSGENSGKKSEASESSKKSSEHEEESSEAGESTEDGESSEAEESTEDEENSEAEESSADEDSAAPKDEKPDKKSVYSAYAKTVQKLIDECGKPRTQNYFYNGVAIVRLIDFDGDGTEELFCVYPQDNDMFANKQEVYGYADGEAVSLYKDRVQNWGTSVDPFVEYIVCDKAAYLLTDHHSTMTETKGTWITFSNNEKTDAMSYYTNAPSFSSGEGQGAELIFNIDGEKVSEEDFDKAINDFNSSGEDIRLKISTYDDETLLDGTKDTLRQLGITI